MQNFTIDYSGNWDSEYSKIIKNSVKKALDNDTKLSNEIFQMPGYSNVYNRIILNTIVEQTSDARYLEIGCWQGSTTCSAIYKNTVKVVCIDNFSEPDLGIATEKILIENLEKYKNENAYYQFINSDFRNVDYTTLEKHNIYLYDGAHEKTDHYDSLVYPLAALEDTFILIVDDWNWSHVREGTLDSISDNKLNIVSDIRVISDTIKWNNGYYMAVIQK
jgi:hypothetical protein